MNPVADLFCGCGGLGSGFNSHLGFQKTLAVDYWDAAHETFRHNNPDVEFRTADLHLEEHRRALAERLRGNCDVLLGGPPCQPFSTLGKRRQGDRRGTLVDAFLDVCLAVRPRVFVIENVRGITSMRHPSGATVPEVVFQRSGDGASRQGYDVAAGFVNTLDYGLAQTRIRWIAVGIRRDAGGMKTAHAVWDAINSQRRKGQVNVRQAIADLPPLKAGEGADVMLVKSGRRTVELFNHRAMAHSRRLIERLSHVPPGGGLPNVPRRLLTPHLRRMLDGEYGNGGHIKNIYGRLEWDKPCGTIVAGIDKITCGRFVHPASDRLLTPRECARLQSFPDDFRFFGGMVASYYLVGNAVPPALSAVLANAIAPVLRRRRRAVKTKTQAAHRRKQSSRLGSRKSSKA